jgi:ribosome maturation factor RimP
MGPFFVRGVFEVRGFTKMREALLRLLEHPVEALGFEVVDIEFMQAGRGGTLRVFIDRRGGGAEQGAAGGDAAGGAALGGITIEDCAAASHAISEVLEAEDPIGGRYTLEVSSPGIDRILRKQAHFERFVGERVAVELKLPIAGRRRFTGPLKSVQGGAIVVEVDGRPHELPLDRIQKARLKP